MDLARGAREQVWWTQYLDLNLDPYLGLEQDTTAITSFTTFYIPALLQTEDYTRAIIGSIAPKMDPDILRQRVEVRMRRQQRLEGDNRRAIACCLMRRCYIVPSAARQSWPPSWPRYWKQKSAAR